MRDSLSAKVTTPVVGHFHDDCLGGLSYLQDVGVESIANIMTTKKCKELGLPVPGTSFSDSLLFDFNGKKVACRYFGGGHSFDNITVWLPENKILFGGRLIRSNRSKSLGNLSDAVVDEWDTTVRKIQKEYDNIAVVIPGHGAYGGPELLSHTIELVKSYKNNLK